MSFRRISAFLVSLTALLAAAGAVASAWPEGFAVSEGFAVPEGVVVPGSSVVSGGVAPPEVGLQAAANDDWTSWGGPHGDFTSTAVGLAESWPADGPREIWRRDLGEGASAIVVDGDRLFTMYRRDGEEVVVAMSSEDGSVLWEHAYDVRVSGFDIEFGAGPHASPLVLGDRLITAGFLGDLLAFDKRTGEVLWSVDLWEDLGGTVRPRGYSSSPIAHEGTIIMPVGGNGRALVGFDPADGSILWSGGDFDNAHATPIIIDVDGQAQVVAFLVDYVAGFDPSTGELLWRHPHRTDYGLNIATPVWGADNLLFVSSAYSGGSRALRLHLEDAVTRVEEVWFTNRMRLHFGNAIRVGDHMYGANGDFGPSFVTALNMADGSVSWRDRSFAKASFLFADGKLIILDEDGTLGLATVSPDGMQVLARADAFESRSWTVPTLAGTRLFARDLEEIAAFELGSASNEQD